MSRFVLPLLVVALCAVGCERSDEKLQQAGKSIASWEATLSLTESQLADDQVPPVFVKQIVKAADEALDEQAETLADAKGGDETKKHELLANVERVRAHARRLNAAAAAGGGSAS